MHSRVKFFKFLAQVRKHFRLSLHPRREDRYNARMNQTEEMETISIPRLLQCPLNDANCTKDEFISLIHNTDVHEAVRDKA